ncbi:MAG: Aconitate hydratase [uncultured Sphingomonas sp.]|uniref:Aconitate hydratase n=1 Tax=uncultured Sphingomonas sp. TaxID=158754 RepID=A0A6J4TBM9_9SPHN|nr:aconitate hydratase AcnA [uncultured Sphingomonas sp.]CAA9519156.1 MAG: Aconitate hydratase [uncultured Sphingomonas sp.]
MTAVGHDTLQTRSTLTVGDKTYAYYSLEKAAAKLGDISRLPFSMKVLLENLLRFEDGKTVTHADLQAIVDWQKERTIAREIQYRPARVLMQDFTGVPAVVDLAAMRDAMKNLGGDPQKINPLVPVDLVIDHSVMVDEFGTVRAFEQNQALEYDRNFERYQFLKWGSEAFNNFRVVPPGTGICHQVNLEYIAQTVWTSADTASGAVDKHGAAEVVAYPDTLVGTDSHTTMVNGLGVLGWGVGGIEAEAAMLGQPVSMLIPEVVGFKLHGSLREGITATDLVLTVTQMLRQKGVVGRFVEFYGPGVGQLTLAERATIANMAPEYGATCGFFPVDARTLDYLRFTARSEARIALVEAYCRAQGMWWEEGVEDPLFTDTLELDMSAVATSLAGPKRPQDRVLLESIDDQFNAELIAGYKKEGETDRRIWVGALNHEVGHGDVMIASITSCTNTSNPSVLVAAGLVARKAREKGLTRKPWVKTSLAPGSQVVTDYLVKSGLQADLDAAGFNLAGYGCMTCIGNSGPLPQPISDAINDNDLVVASVLSGNRNFEGRVSPDCRANYLASPPLVVAYALKGSVRDDMINEPLGTGSDGEPVYLRDVWPTNAEVRETIDQYITSDMYAARYANVFAGDKRWASVPLTGGDTYSWPPESTYIQNPPYFEGMTMEAVSPGDIAGARLLAIFGDSITTDHISPAGSIKADSPAGRYLQEHGVARLDFNSYGARRGNHEVMMRGTFANIRIRNKMLTGVEGGFTRHIPTGEQLPIYDAAMRYKEQGTPLVILAGKEYGTGSSRDWAAKGTVLLGVRAVIAESFERIHRSNLVGMGVLPLQFPEGQTAASLGLDGSETFSIADVAGIKPRQDVEVTVTEHDGSVRTLTARCRIDTYNELEYFHAGGILPYVLRRLAA